MASRNLRAWASRQAPREVGCLSVAGWGLALFAVVGCSGEVPLGQVLPNSCDFSRELPESTTVSVGTFWRYEPDSSALDELSHRGEGLEWTVVPFEYKSREELIGNMRDERVDVFQANGGADVLQFVTDDELPPVCPLDPIYEEANITETYFEAAWRPVTCRGSHYAFPLNVHRLNTVIINDALYQKLRTEAENQGQLQVPPFEDLESREELIQVLELAKSIGLENDDGQPVVPLSLCLGTETNVTWPLQHLAFENVLASMSGAYEAIWFGRGLSDVDRRALIDEVLAEVRRLLAVSHRAPEFDTSCGLVEAGAEELTEETVGVGGGEADDETSQPGTWQQAAKLVGQGKALLTIGGDWLRSAVNEGQRPEIVSHPFPGTEDLFVYTPDTFAVQKLSTREGSPVETGAEARMWLMDVLHHVDTQLEFAQVKQAIPARANLTKSQIDSLDWDPTNETYLADTYRTFRDCHETDSECRMLLAVSGLAPAASPNRCFDKLGPLLAKSLDLQTTDEAWEDFELECSAPPPQTAEQALQILREVISSVSRSPFDAECRD